MLSAHSVETCFGFTPRCQAPGCPFPFNTAALLMTFLSLPFCLWAKVSRSRGLSWAPLPLLPFIPQPPAVWFSPQPCRWSSSFEAQQWVPPGENFPIFIISGFYTLHSVENIYFFQSFYLLMSISLCFYTSDQLFCSLGEILLLFTFCYSFCIIVNLYLSLYIFPLHNLTYFHDLANIYK